MKIGIVGGGSIGLLFAYYFSLNYKTTVYTRTIEQKDLLNKDGLFLHKSEVDYHTSFEAQAFNEWTGTDDLTIVTLKQYQLEQVLRKFRATETKSSFLFLQNGMGHINSLKTLHNKDIMVGVVEHGALKVDSNHVLHTGIGNTKISGYKGTNQKILSELLSFNVEDFPFQYETHYEEMLISKLVVNAVINPLTALLKVSNGQLVDNPFYFEMVKDVFGEIKSVLSLHNEEQHFHNVINICRKTSKNHSSMLRDIEEKRPTEVDAILGYLLEKATENRLKVPLLQTFYNGIKGKEHVGEGG